MSDNIEISVASLVASVTSSPSLVCGNIYTVHLTLDDDWSDATRIYLRVGYRDVYYLLPVSMNTLETRIKIPENVPRTTIGVYSDTLRTTTAAMLLSAPSAWSRAGDAQAGFPLELYTDIIDNIATFQVDQALDAGSTRAVSNASVTEAITILEESISKASSEASSDLTAMEAELKSLLETHKVEAEKAYMKKADVGDGALVIRRNGVQIASTSANASADAEADISVPDKVSDLPNDAGYITKAVSDLANYYTKSDTYTKAQVDALVGVKLSISKVSVLPTSGISTTTIYFVPDSSAPTGNVYDEYVYISGKWEKIGTTAADLDAYELKADLAKVAESGSYNDLSDRPSLAKGAATGTGNVITDLTLSGHTITPVKGIKALTEHPSVDVSADTTSTASPAAGGKVAVVDSVTRDKFGHVLKVNTKTITLPADAKATQSPTDSASELPVLLKPSAGTGTVTDGARFASGISAVPSAGRLKATEFQGDLDGTAARATADASGRNIADTYATKTALAEATDAASASWRIGMSFDAEVFKTDPAGCLAYTDDAAGWTPIDNTASKALQTCAVLGSWEWDSNPMLRTCYYAVLEDTGDDMYVLDPNDFTRSIDGEDTSEAIKTHDVVLVVPKRYVRRNASGIGMSAKKWSSDWTCKAHTLGSKTGEQLCVAVYPTYIDDSGVAHSWSGVNPTRLKTRAAFRTAAVAKNAAVTNGGIWHQWNLHEWSLIRDMDLFPLKHFNSQVRLGQGWVSGGTSEAYDKLTGLCDKLGPFAGDVSHGTIDYPVKALLEGMWGNGWQFIDDMDVNPSTADDADNPTLYTQEVYAGNNTPSDIVCESTATANNANKELVGYITGSTAEWKTNWATAINTTADGWGLPLTEGGSASVGLCDTYYTRFGQTYCHVPLVGGRSDRGSAAGLSSLAVDSSVGSSHWSFGSRLAFLR